MELIKQVQQIATNPQHTRWLAPLQLFGDAALCTLIVWKIPYTEIDWTTYMQHISLYISGERDYSKLTGSTGPLVYPAAHVYIYRLLYYLTDSGQNILLAQQLFVGLYLFTLFIVMQCYRKAGAPGYVLVLLSLSKRVHSIFMLRMFNDCFAVLFLWMAIWCYQRRFWSAGTIAFAIGLGVKMSLLLALPAVGMVLWQGMGRNGALWQAASIGQIQILIAYPFIVGGLRSYVTKAFEFTRQFMFKWTVNWRFVGEETFLSESFSYSLLGAHVVLLGIFGMSRWLKPSELSPAEAINHLLHPPSKAQQDRIARRVTPDFVLTSILSAIIIGCLCARSLHYQFFAYIAWSTPFLLWSSGMHPILIYGLNFAQEWAWNVYPSTDGSSMVAVGCMAATIGSIWLGTRSHLEKPPQQHTAGHEHAE